MYDDLDVLTKPKSLSQPHKQKINEFQKCVVEVLKNRKQLSDNCGESDIDEDFFLLSFLPMLKQISINQKFDFKIQVLEKY